MTDRPKTRADLTKEFTKRVCKWGEGNACCRYLTADGKGFDCEKHTELKAVIDDKVARGEFTARSDNCPGLDRP